MRSTSKIADELAFLDQLANQPGIISSYNQLIKSQLAAREEFVQNQNTNDKKDYFDKYEFLMFNLNTQITPTINKMLVLQKEVQNLDSLLIKTSNLSKNLEQINLKIENSTDILLKQKIVNFSFVTFKNIFNFRKVLY